MKKENLFCFSTLMVCLYWSQVPGFAQSHPDSVRLLNELVITATKFPKAQHETGKVILVLDADLIQRSEGKNLAQLLNEQAGLEINGANSSPGKDLSIYQRGATGQYTLILIDGIPITDASGVGGAFDLRLISLDQFERIEILKGSQSTLYGSDAIAGVINIFTKQKDGGQASIRYGSYNTVNGSVGLGGSAGIWKYHAGYSHDRSTGISEAKEESGNKLFDKDGFAKNSFHANLAIKPADPLSIKGIFRYVDYKGQYDAGAFTDDVSAEFQSRLIDIGLSGEYTLAKGVVQGKFLHSETDRQFESLFGTYLYNGKTNNLDLFYHKDLNRYIQFSSGINFQNLQMEVDQTAVDNPSTELYSVYVSGYLREFQGFSAEIGTRVNQHSEFGQVFTFSINPSYRINRELKLFANYSTGFKAPTLNELFGPFGANPDLEPQYSRHAEAGVQYNPLKTRNTFRGTVFTRQINNAIVYGNQGYINFDRQTDHGLELEASTRLNDKLSVQAYYTYTTGAVHTRTFDNRDTSFNNLIRRPKHTFGGSLGYKITPKCSTVLSIKSVGKRKDNFFDPGTFSSIPVKLPSYQLLNFYIEYKCLNGKIKGYIDAKNLLNKVYSEVYGYNALRFNINAGMNFIMVK